MCYYYLLRTYTNAEIKIIIDIFAIGKPQEGYVRIVCRCKYAISAAIPVFWARSYGRTIDSLFMS